MTAPSAYTVARPSDDRQSERPYDWRDDAACAEVGPGPFFPAKGESTKAAKLICARCDVRDRCLAEVIDDPEIDGIWGGLTVVERRQIRKQRRAAS